jgi:N-methylhydantoinase A
VPLAKRSLTIAYIIGVDCGGTFTDCVLVDDDGALSADKAFTTPDNLTRGILEAIAYAARPTGRSLDAVLAETRVLAIGTTALTNRLVSRAGARVGLLTTRGHEDAIVVGRVLAKTEGLPEAAKRDIIAWDKPTPLVPRVLIRGVPERVDYKGAVVVALDEQAALAAVDELVAQGIAALAVSLLWAFANPLHERTIARLVATRYPDLFVSLSSEVAPVLGEYERTTTTVLNAYLGPGARRDLGAMREAFAAAGFGRSFFLMQSSGGLIGSTEAATRGVNLLASGPVGGAMAATLLGNLVDTPNVILADMGGTSFDVGLIVGGEAEYTRSAVYDRYRAMVPTVGIVSIGTGGGSIARVDPHSGTLHVGPRSAGSVPGPVCYGRGGTEPTVTDADVALARISPERFFAGRRPLDRPAAEAAIAARIAAPLGYDAVRAAAGIVDIADAQMADLIRKVTVERGHDPRDFVLMAYGGAGPVHIGACARELGIRRVLVPALASVFSALGIGTSDWRLFGARSLPMRPPFEPARLQAAFDGLAEEARGAVARAGLTGEPRFARFVDMRFRNQIHEVTVPVDFAIRTAADVERLLGQFYALYEQSFGPGTAYPEAGVEVLTFRLLCEVPLTRASLPRGDLVGAAPPAAAHRGTRAVYFQGTWQDTVVLDHEALLPGNTVAGPAVIESPTSTLVVHPGQQASVDPYRNVILTESEDSR